MDAMARSGIKPHEEPGEPLPSERRLTGISIFSIHFPADRIDNEIVASQTRICEFLDFALLHD
jgi:hypothetical protein